VLTLTHDPKFNIAYLRLAEPSGRVRTLCVTPDLNIDLGPDGRVCGIEFLDPATQLGLAPATCRQTEGNAGDGHDTS